MVNMAFELGKTYLDSMGDKRRVDSWLYYGENRSPERVDDQSKADAFNAGGYHYFLNGELIGNIREDKTRVGTGPKLIDDSVMKKEEAITFWLQVIYNYCDVNPFDKVRLVSIEIANIGERISQIYDKFGV